MEIFDTNKALELFLQKYNLPQNYECIHFGLNAVYKIKEKEKSLLIKVYRNVPEIEKSLMNEVRFVKFLLKNNFKTPKYDKRFPEFIKCDKFYFTVQEWIDADKIELDYLKLGEILKELHKISRKYIAINPISYTRNNSIVERINGAKYVDQKTKDKLLEIAEKVNLKIKRIFNESKEDANEKITLHGDFHSSNILQLKGDIYVIDFGAPVSFRELDLLLIALSFKHSGITEKEYLDFSKGYGLDVREWVHYNDFIELMELNYTVFLINHVNKNKYAKEEFENRVNFLVTGDGKFDFSEKGYNLLVS